ncbi:MAG: hypothetical protein KGL39_34895 [Patescibacteria group bacterium]|nr:hypothetical protein [Patescibacteria group bacterium]
MKKKIWNCPGCGALTGTAGEMDCLPCGFCGVLMVERNEIETNCKNCRWFKKIFEDDSFGGCRATAPHSGSVILPNTEGQIAHDSRWPLVNENDFCKEFNHRAEV